MQRRKVLNIMMGTTGNSAVINCTVSILAQLLNSFPPNSQPPHQAFTISVDDLHPEQSKSTQSLLHWQPKNASLSWVGSSPRCTSSSWILEVSQASGRNTPSSPNPQKTHAKANQVNRRPIGVGQQCTRYPSTASSLHAVIVSGYKPGIRGSSWRRG